jgi:hypothetical protein
MGLIDEKIEGRKSRATVPLRIFSTLASTEDLCIVRVISIFRLLVFFFTKALKLFLNFQCDAFLIVAFLLATIKIVNVTLWL